MPSSEAIMETHFPGLKLVRRGKVRDLYDMDDHLLIVATDRLSAYDVVMPQAIPGKGKVLTQISNYWFGLMKDILPNHLVCTDVEDFPPACREYWDQLRDRSVLVKKTTPLAIECVARGYLSGSGWNEYQATQSVCGVRLPAGMVESSALPSPIFTPATKAEEGHDENIDFDRCLSIVGEDIAHRVREYTLTIYKRACAIAEQKGIIIADTKMEFGLCDGELILIDELLTPDSSRFWPKAEYMPGHAQLSFDKQYVRDYLLSIHFNKLPPGPQLPADIIQKTSSLYTDVFKTLTGRELDA